MAVTRGITQLAIAQFLFRDSSCCTPFFKRLEMLAFCDKFLLLLMCWSFAQKKIPSLTLQGGSATCSVMRSNTSTLALLMKLVFNCFRNVASLSTVPSFQCLWERYPNKHFSCWFSDIDTCSCNCASRRFDTVLIFFSRNVYPWNKFLEKSQEVDGVTETRTRDRWRCSCMRYLTVPFSLEKQCSFL